MMRPMKPRVYPFIPVWVALSLIPATAPAEPITTGSLLSDMIDLTGMSEFPDPPYTCRQFSSWDRAARSPTQNWFANGDRGHYLRVENRNGRTEYVMMDAEGPGAVVRIWSANPDGVLRAYLDGSETPSLEAPLKELLGGSHPQFPYPIAGERSRGWNLYFPIPYATHCKLTSDAGDFYYHVNYRTYAPGTEVVSFQTEQLTECAGELAEVAGRLAAPGEEHALPIGAETRSFATRVPPGASATLGSWARPGAIRQFTLRWAPSEMRDEPALRSTLLSMTFDGATTVESPLGDFFGAAPGINPFHSLPLSVAEDGKMSSRWIMPFQESATIHVHNHGTEPVLLEGEFIATPYLWTPATLHFHAGWRIQHDLSTDPKIDWNYLTAQGRGVFAGAAFFVDNPVKTWWGEGDEKIYVDGEPFPSHFGTGTEDYYGYAWCSPQPFTHAYHNQPRCDGPDNFGRTSVNRFHILDRIPFTRNFRFDMEIWHWKPCRINAAVTTYWYARPGASDGFPPILPGDLALRAIEPFTPYRVEGAIEGETMRVIASTGTPEPQSWNGTSNEHHLWWKGGQQPGDQLVLGFDVPAAGAYRVIGRFLRAADYGTAQFSINRQPAGSPIDFYHDGVVLTEEMALGTFELKKGENQLSARITGAHEQAIKAYMVGIDYLRIERVGPAGSP